MPRQRDDWTGIYPHFSMKGQPQNGWKAVVSGGGRKEKRIRKWFHMDTPLRVMQDWRRDTQARLRLERRRIGTRARGTFAADVDRYLKHPNVTRLMDYDARQFEILRWVPYFGTKASAEITPDQIRAVMEQWATEPRTLANGKLGRTPLSENRINKFLTALTHMGSTLYGRSAMWAARDVPLLDRPPQKRRDLSLDEVDKIFAAADEMAIKPVTQQMVARLRVMVTTGLPSGTMKELTPDRVDLDERVVYRERRHKGAGVAASPLPLSDEAVAAFERFIALNCWGTFSDHTSSRILNRAAKRAGLRRHIRPYDLRHTFLTRVASVSKDEGAVADLAQHANPKTTRKYYIHGSVPQRAKAAIEALNQAGRKLGGDIGGNQNRNSPELPVISRTKSTAADPSESR